ncbi:MAG: D-alanine--D-alanine ligase [Eubacterium sp.]
MKQRRKIIVSACLAGEPCRYDGKANLIPEIRELVLTGKAVPVCPECLGDLKIPRNPCEIRVVKGIKKVYNVQNEDLTAAFEWGATKALAIAKMENAKFAILKAKSPSCGCDKIYNGRFDKRLVDGDGITAALFKQNGFAVITESEWLKDNQEDFMESNKISLGVVFGGQSGEHEISCVSAYNILGVINRDKYDITLIGITKTGQWKIYNGDYTNIKDDSWEKDTDYLVEDFSMFTDPIIRNIDIFFPILHGPMGEDGTIQGLFELLNKPYVGCGVLASAVGMDKVFTKILCADAGIPTGPYIYFKKQDWEKEADSITKSIENRGFPVFIKPVNMGSSVGITKAHNRDEFIAGVEEALIYDHKILVEGFINGREVECGVLCDNGEIKASFPGEVIATKEFYDYEAKYKAKEPSKIVIPVQLSDDIVNKIRDYAVKAYKAIDASGLCRVDFFVTRSTYEIFLNEINTLPGFTEISLYPKMWEATGIGYADLVEKLIQSADRKRVTL